MVQTQSVVLAGGRGTRLPEFPFNKHLALVWDRPQLRHVIDQLASVAPGATTVVYSEPYGQQVIDYVTANFEGISVRSQGEPNGILRAAQAGVTPMADNDLVVIMLGDQFFGDLQPLKDLVKKVLLNESDAGIVLRYYEDAWKHNVVTEAPTGMVFTEKPDNKLPGDVALGFYVFRYGALMRETEPDVKGEYSFSNLLAQLKKVSYVRYDTPYWSDNGTPGNILKCANYLAGR